MNTKQVIVMRKDLGMRKGKMIAQGAHASMAFLTKDNLSLINYNLYQSVISTVEREWLESSFTKVCVSVNSLNELFDIQSAAFEAKIKCHVITDSGKTEFDSVPTITCLALGPDYSEKIDKITGHLPLL